MMLAAALSLWLVSPGIVIRHDVDDAQHRCIDQCRPATALFHLGGRLGAGTGTLIAPRWVLTAAHVTPGLTNGDPVTIAGQTAQVAAVHVHPQAAQQAGFVDVALVMLADEIEDVQVAALYAGTDETGRQVVFEGAGRTGNGRDGLAAFDRVPRQAGNRVEGVRDHWLRFRFDPPPQALPDEGISGPGDSGGPAYLRDAEGLCLVGVSSWQDNREQHRNEGVYGVLEYYVRSSSVLAWVQAVLAESQDSARSC